MDNGEWLKIAATLISGGAMGAIITGLVTTARNRIQPIGRRIETIPLFRHTLGESTLEASITISDGQKEYKFDNMFLADIQIVNRGNRDIKEFKCGLTLSGGDKAVHIVSESSDRHHVVDQMTIVTPDNSNDKIDFVLKPFNRRDSYSFKLYVVV